MEKEFPRIDHDKSVSPYAQEVEYALHLSSMINKVKEDPAQLRLAIYEFARARLKTDTLRGNESERRRLSDALETAIQGVEDFSVRREQNDRLRSHFSALQIEQGDPRAARSSNPITTIRQVTPSLEDVVMLTRDYISPSEQPIVEIRTWSWRSRLAPFFVGISIFCLVAGLAYNRQSLQLLFGDPRLPPPVVAKPASGPSEAAPQAPARSSNSLPFPVPSDYGIYALNGKTLSELYLLPERVPDKRIAISTPVEQPSRTTLPDGKASFILFRRDLANNAPDRVEVRVVARVVRALTFDAKGKPSFSKVSDLWNFRGISYEFRVRPVAGNPEMLLVQSEQDSALPPGRYVLVLRDQGYDFTVDGDVTDVAQCLERTDAANGVFYSECQKSE